ncbi:MAG: hypothetical protein ACLU2J_03430 [Clostridia bacterium]
MKLKENTTQRKLRGGYYTPQKLADYITKITLKDKRKFWNQVVEMVLSKKYKEYTR